MISPHPIPKSSCSTWKLYSCASNSDTSFRFLSLYQRCRISSENISLCIFVSFRVVDFWPIYVAIRIFLSLKSPNSVTALTDGPSCNDVSAITLSDPPNSRFKLTDHGPASKIPSRRVECTWLIVSSAFAADYLYVIFHCRRSKQIRFTVSSDSLRNTMLLCAKGGFTAFHFCYLAKFITL